jgi:hypothetical protein
MRTNLLPNRIRREDTKLSFCILKKDSTVDYFDTSISFESKQALCPFKVDFDIGANVDAINLPMLELKLRGGIGSSYIDFPSRFEYKADTSIAHFDSINEARVKNSMIMLPLDAIQRFEFGPQGSATINLRIGRLGTAGGEIRVFAPVVPEMRFTRPDFDLTLTVSWRLAQSLTLDYDYTYTLKQPEDVNARENYNTHKIYLRFSFSSR